MVVLLLIFFAQHFCLQSVGEEFQIEEFIAKSDVEALAVGVLPWGARLDVEGLDSCPIKSTAVRQRATRARQVWSWDFVHEQTAEGRSLRILTLIDEHTRQCLAMHAARSIRAVDVITVMEMALMRYGRPEHIRSDNGPEFIAYAVKDWLEDAGIKTMYIEPGAPWENGHIESFHDMLRDECLNRELFHTLAEVRVILESWRVEYNERRPHSSLGYLTPSEYEQALNRVDGGQTPRRSPRQAFGGNMGC